MKLSELFKFQNKTSKNKKFKRNFEDINYNKFNKIFMEGKGTLIDVRSRQEYAENHFDGAINIPLDEIEKSIKKVAPDKNRTVLLYCQYGSRSKKAQNILKKLGYTNVYNLKDGLDGI